MGIDALPPTLTTLADAARTLGYATADGLRRAFSRRLIPARFLIRLGKRTVRVDLQSLLVFVREQAAEREGVRP